MRIGAACDCGGLDGRRPDGPSQGAGRGLLALEPETIETLIDTLRGEQLPDAAGDSPQPLVSLVAGPWVPIWSRRLPQLAAAAYHPVGHVTCRRSHGAGPEPVITIVDRQAYPGYTG